MKFRFLLSAVMAFAIFSLITFSSSSVNAQMGEVIDTEMGDDDGGGGNATCYSSYDGCALSNCISRLICDGGGTCTRTQVGTVSDKGTC
jgi:hypothetical protein